MFSAENNSDFSGVISNYYSIFFSFKLLS